MAFDKAQLLYFLCKVLQQSKQLPEPQKEMPKPLKTTILSLLLAISFQTVSSQSSSLDTSDISKQQAWTFAILVGSALSILGFFAALIILGLKKLFSDQTFHILVGLIYALGCGTIVGDTIVNTLPQAFIDSNANPVLVSLSCLCGIIFFLFVERFLGSCGIIKEAGADQLGQKHQNSEHLQGSKQYCNHATEMLEMAERNLVGFMDEHEHIPIKKSVVKQVVTKSQQNHHDKFAFGKINHQQSIYPQNIEHDPANNVRPQLSKEIKQSKQASEKEMREGKQLHPAHHSIFPFKQTKQNTEGQTCFQRFIGKQAAGYFNFFSTLIRSFFDGIAVGSAYATLDRAKYIPIVIGVFGHELPKEMGSLGILLKSRFQGYQTLVCRSLANITAIFGVIIGLTLGSVSGSVRIYFMSFVAGNFLYSGAKIWVKLLVNNNIWLNVLEFLSLSAGFGINFLFVLFPL